MCVGKSKYIQSVLTQRNHLFSKGTTLFSQEKTWSNGKKNGHLCSLTSKIYLKWLCFGGLDMLHQLICCFSLQKDYWQKKDRKLTFSANKCWLLWNNMSKPQSKPKFRNFLRLKNRFGFSCYHWIMSSRENGVVLLENKWFRWVRTECIAYWHNYCPLDGRTTGLILIRRSLDYCQKQ